MAQELPFLNFTEEDVKSLTPINSQCTVLCVIDKIFAKENKAKDGTNVFFRFVCIDDNSPEKGKPSIRSFPLGYPSMWAPLIMAVKRIEKDEFVPGPMSIQEFEGKELYVKFDLVYNPQNDESTIQPKEFYRSDKPLV